MHKSILQDVKLYIAFDSEDHYVMVDKASSNGQWYCTDCHCPLKLCNDTTGEEVWFEHAPDDETTKAQVTGCGHLLAAIRKRVGLAPMFPYTFYHLTHYWFVAADIPVVNDIPVHYADAIRCNVRRPPQGSLPLLTRQVLA